MSKRAQWQEWNKEGFIPGPEEDEEAFEKRVAFCQNLEQHLSENVDTPLPFQIEPSESKLVLEQAFPLTLSLYGIAPRWVPLFFGNYQLAPWHGGCAWIFQLNNQTPTAAFLQLRSQFRLAPNFLKIYHRKELVAHELAHVGRMLYEEPQFEEFFAYASSPSKWRRWFGPIVQSSKESFLFVLLLGFVVMTDFALFSIGYESSTWIWGLKLLPAALIGWAVGRLAYRHRALKRCLSNLEQLMPKKNGEHLLYRLRDSEIKLFSTLSQSKILEWVQDQAEHSFRWRFLKTLYYKGGKGDTNT